MGVSVAAGLLVVVLLVVPLLTVVPLVAALVAWVVLRPADDEPVARARLRRASGTTTAAATALAVVIFLPAAVLALGSPELGAPALLLAGLLHVAVLWVGEALTARPHAALRTALLTAEPRTPLRTALTGLLVGAMAGLFLLLAVALFPGGTAGVLPLPPNGTLLAAVPAVVLTGLVLLASRQVRRRSSDSRLHPEVDATARARAVHRLLRAGAASTCATLGITLLGMEMRAAAATGDVTATAALVLGGLLVLVAAVVSVLPPPRLLLRPDQVPAAAAPEAGLTTGAA